MTKHQHILQAMTVKSVCPCCYLPLDGNGDQYCRRTSCVAIRAAVERQHHIREHGKFILQYETFDATVQVKRFDDSGERDYHASLIFGQVTDMFGINPDGSTVDYPN